MKKTVLQSWVLIVAIMMAACNLPQQVVPTPSPTNLPDATATDLAENIFDQGTFLLNLPPGWSVFGPLTVDSASNGSYELYLLGINPSGADGPGTSRVVVANASNWSPEEFVISQCSTCPGNPFEALTLAGMPALRTQIGGGGVPMVITWTFVEHDGNLIALAIHDPQTLEPLEEVIESLEFK